MAVKSGQGTRTARKKKQTKRKAQKEALPQHSKHSHHSYKSAGISRQADVHQRPLLRTHARGVCMGLAWTALGGATLYVEAIKVAGEKTEMKLTGQAGQVMKESSEIAWSYLHSAIHKYAPGYTFFEKSQVHIHIPEGATPKDGPSAGITMVTALLSLLTDTPVLENWV